MISYDVAEFGAPLKRFERDTPMPSGTEVLVRTRAAGVCHSDLHLWEGYYDLGGGQKMSVAARGIVPPFTMGHEIVGEVVAFGPEAQAESGGAEIGESYVVFPWIGCGDCAVCKGGEENYCLKPRFLGIYTPGGYGDHVLVPHPRYLVPLSGLGAAEAAPYACSGITTYSALNKLSSLLQSEPIVLMGAGGLGLMCLTLLKAMGGRGAVVVDIDPAKRDAAEKGGALAVIDGRAEDAAKQIVAACGGAVRGVIDFVGSSSSAKLGVDILSKGGKLVIVGLFGGELTLSLPLIPMRAITIQGSYVGNLQELRDLMALVSRTRPARIPIGERPLSDASAALEELHAGKTIGRTVLTP